MKHTITRISSICLFFISFTCNAETVSQKEAMAWAELFFNTLYGEVSAKPKLVWNGRELTTNRLFSPFYVYNHPKGGFVMISAENKSFPILAYSKNNRFNMSDLGDDEREQFERFAREIELIRYDSRNAERAFSSWINRAEYITNTINKPYDTPEYRSLNDEEMEKIETIDRRNSWIVMPTAVEYDIYNPERYRSYTLDDITAEEYVPFSFYEDFIQLTFQEEEERNSAYQRILINPDPEVIYQGGGHFTLKFPCEISLMRIYAIDGRKMIEKYYNDNVANIDLSGLSSGYYVVMCMTADKYIYGFKIAK